MLPLFFVLFCFFLFVCFFASGYSLFWASQVVLVVKNCLTVQETQEMKVWSLGRKDPLEEGIATHSSILAWRIPWTEEPGRPQSIGLQRVGHDWSDLVCTHTLILGFLGGLVVKNLPANAGATGDTSSIPELGRYPGVRNGHPVWYSCLGNPMDRGAWRATVHGIAKESDMTWWLTKQPLFYCHFYLSIIGLQCCVSFC